MATEVIPLSHKEFLRIDRDYEKAVKAIFLGYANINSPVIERIKKEKSSPAYKKLGNTRKVCKKYYVHPAAY